MTVPRRIAPELRGTWRVAPRFQWPAGAVVVAVLAVMPALTGFEITNWTVALTDVTLLLSLGLLVRTARQISLCHAGFAAIGAVAFSKFAVGLGVPWLPALILSGLVMVPIGALIAIPAIRLSGLYLALATLGFGMLLQNMFYQTNWMFGTTTVGLTMPRPSLGFLDVSSDSGFYYVVLVITIIVALLVVTLDRSRLGRLLRGIGESTTAVSTSGATTSVTQVLAFCIAAAIAGISGALLGSTLGTVTGTNFDPMSSLLLAAVVLVTPGGVPWYAVFGGLLVGLLPDYFTSQTVTDALQAGFGLGVILHGFGVGPRAPARVREVLEARGSGRWSRGSQAGAPSSTPVATAGAVAGAPARLRVEHVTVRFGGQVALDDVSLEVPTGAITGLIGPNGAGKTTLFNVCSGLLRPAAGTVVIGDRVLSRSGPAQRARAGLGRTFQHVELCESLSVADNVAFGREAGLAGASPRGQMLPAPGDGREVADAVAAALALCDLEEVADRPVQTLSTGQRRLVELARCLAGPFRILLLDEPSSGLNGEETRQFSGVLQQVVAQRGVGILLVEHDMSLVMSVCSYIHVLDFGQPIFAGTPAEVRGAEVVQAAYLGRAAVGSALGG
jgi:ABC-type branched-subunit amino acid transport system ATPase component/ABC-type branched-subunit amino acid transport system permease subunit